MVQSAWRLTARATPQSCTLSLAYYALHRRRYHHHHRHHHHHHHHRHHHRRRRRRRRRRHHNHHIFVVVIVIIIVIVIMFTSSLSELSDCFPLAYPRSFRSSLCKGNRYEWRRWLSWCCKGIWNHQSTMSTNNWKGTLIPVTHQVRQSIHLKNYWKK